MGSGAREMWVLLEVGNWKIIRLGEDYENPSFGVEFQQ
jgi:hypothetical protein